MAQSSRLTALNSLRGFGILLVVLGAYIAIRWTGTLDFLVPYAVVLHHLRHVVPRKTIPRLI